MLLVLLLTLSTYLGHRVGREGRRVYPDYQAGDEARVEVAVIPAGEGLRTLQLVLQQFVHQVELVIPLQGPSPVRGRAAGENLKVKSPRSALSSPERVTFKGSVGGQAGDEEEKESDHTHVHHDPS